MKRLVISLTVLAWLVLAAGCANFSQVVSGSPKQFQERQIIVTLHEDIRSQWQEIHKEILDRFDVQAVGQFPLKAIKVNCLVYRVSDMVVMSEVISRLEADPRIQLVQRNQIFADQGTASPDTHAYADLSYAPKLIHADLAHQWATGKGVRLAVIDTGADTEHPDLKGRVNTTENFVEGGTDSFADDRHGTGVVGVIAATANDGAGINGIAPDAKIGVYKACWYAEQSAEKASCSSWTLAKAIDMAITAGSRIINLSLNGPADPLLEKLLATAHQQNIVVVAAASEKGQNPGFPAALDFVIPVISANPRGEVVNTQWQARCQAIAAPGIEILTTMPHANYGFLSGSSLATAHVSGVVALMLQSKPTLTPSEVKIMLQQSANSSGVTTAKPQKPPLIDACQAVAALAPDVSC